MGWVITCSFVKSNETCENEKQTAVDSRRHYHHRIRGFGLVTVRLASKPGRGGGVYSVVLSFLRCRRTVLAGVAWHENTNQQGDR